ncbi:ABC transporter permease [Vibrio sp. PP-XX7]
MTTSTTSRFNQVIICLIIGLCFLLLIIPFSLAILWSLVDPSHAWAYPDILPPVLSFRRWGEIWTTTSLPLALFNSYTLAPTVAICAILLALPTAYAFGRLAFPGKATAQSLSMLPLVVPSFVVAIFFSSLLTPLGIHSRFLGILVGIPCYSSPMPSGFSQFHLPSCVRILLMPARDLGSDPLSVFRHAHLPILRPGPLAEVSLWFSF